VLPRFPRPLPKVEETMKFQMLTSLTLITLFSALTVPVQLSAQHTRYKLIDLGTFGGPASYFSNGFDGILNSEGSAVGWADTSTPDPYPKFCFNPDCFVSHAFQSRNGVLTDLGTLPHGASSQAFWISANGLIAGNSQNGQIDPLIPGFPEFRAVLWKDGKIINLGTLEGGHESLVSAVNSRGQVVGVALNTVPDPFSGFQARAFLWQNGRMQDLGTLGGQDANAFFVNERGQVAGFSFTNATPNPTTGFPTQDPFLWEPDTMLDLGTLGGTVGMPSALNNRGQVVGVSKLAGDLTSHPFLWTKSSGMQDLGTLGGNNGLTNWINDAGDIVGKADLPGSLPQNHDAVLWRHGTIIDLGTLPGDSCSNAYYVNSRGQVVGTSESRELCLIPTGEHAFLWENGGPMIDLNTLIPVGSSLELTFAVAINDRAEIIGFGAPPGCAPANVEVCGHAYVLIPCNGNLTHSEGCQDVAPNTAAATGVSLAPTMQGPATENQSPLGFRGVTSPLKSPFGKRLTPWYRGSEAPPQE
jgi:probable HAF family extracellular repeat protein